MATNTAERKLSFSKFTPTEQQFLRVAESIISRHLDILLSEVKRKYPLSIDTDFLQSIYVSLVADKVVLLVSRAAVLELNLARLLGHLQGSTPQEPTMTSKTKPSITPVAMSILRYGSFLCATNVSTATMPVKKSPTSAPCKTILFPSCK